VVCLFLSIMLWFLNRKKYYKNLLIFMTAAICAIYGFAYINLGYTFAGDHEEIIDDAVGLAEEMELPEHSGFARADFYECFENMGLYWNVPSIRCFHSIVPASVMEFYPTVDVTRDVSSKPGHEYYELRSLLSVRYLYADADEASPESVLCNGFEYLETVNGYHIYENENYIPMGFTFDEYITEEQYYNVHETQRCELLLSSIVLNDSQALRYGSVLEHRYETEVNVPYEDFRKEVKERRSSSSYYFECDHKGFTSKIYLPEENLVFFSVPYDKGWTAYVNGVETAIEKVDIGFMAVYAEQGINEIVFEYRTPGLLAGAITSVAFIAVLVAYSVFFHYEKKRAEDDMELMSRYYGEKSAAASESFEPELAEEEDMTIVRTPAEVPPYTEYTGPEEKIYPEL